MVGFKKKAFRLFVSAALIVTGGLGTMVVTATSASATRTLKTVLFSQVYPEFAINYWASEGADQVSVAFSAGSIVFHDENASSMSIVDDNFDHDTGHTPCHLDNLTLTDIICPTVATNANGDVKRVFGVTVMSWAGNDTLSASGSATVSGSSEPIRITLSGAEDNDTLTSVGGFSNLVGWTGNDILTSGPGTAGSADSIDAGEGDDTIYANSAHGSGDKDGIYCRGGTDTLYKDAVDVIYGGGVATCETIY